MNQRKQFNDLSTVINSLDTVREAQNNTPKLWSPEVQLQLASQNTQQNINQPYYYGPALVNSIYGNNNYENKSAFKDYDKSLFFQNYINPRDAMKDHQTNVANVQNIATNLNNPPEFGKRCNVFPPLLIRYTPPRGTPNENKFVPIELLPGGELKLTDKVPDIILNFHSDSKAITFTTCDIKREKLPDFNIFVSSVYNLHELDPNKTVDIQLFTMMYDQQRYSLLQSLHSRIPRK